MFGKNFVSVSFTPTRLRLIQLDSKKEKAGKFASVDLPDGLIKNYKVEDVNALAKILKATWGKMRIKERAVGLVIPEFSTFSKLFTLPKLTVGELDEAVRWQAQEYLPTEMEAMILDWKIVSTAETDTQVLVVAMDKDVLAGYVKATEEAKLFPLVVETPSLSMARFAESGNKASLIFYNNFGEVIITLSRGKEIYGSAVVGADKIENIVSTAQRITNHYKDVKVEDVLIGGAISKELVDSLTDKLGVNVKWIDEKIKGLTPQQTQEYLVPISLQKKEAYEPANETTVNLLPVELAEKYKIEKKKVQVWTTTLMITLLVWTSFLAALATFLFLGQQVANINTGVSQSEQAKQNEEVTAEITTINQTAERVLAIKNAYVYPQTVLNDIERAKPAGVTITSYKLDFDNGSIEILGIATDRPALIDFKQTLEQNENYSDVVIPISNFEVESNLEFSMSTVYLPAAKKKEKK